jgi:hypothetical protein
VCPLMAGKRHVRFFCAILTTFLLRAMLRT